VCETGLTRRQLLRYIALVAATFPLSGSLLESVHAAGPAVPMHLELVTVTDTEAVITWFTGDGTAPDEFGRPTPVAAPGRVLIGTSPDPTTWVEVGAHGPTPYHYVEVRGLKPGTTYYWRAESNGIPATPSVVPLPGVTPPTAAPPVFTTMVPPPGKEIGRVAWLNDMHFGEGTSGLILGNGALPGGGLPPGYAADPDNPYWRFMGAAAVAEAKGRGCTLLLANGDLTSEARPKEVAESRALLDTFGTFRGADQVGPNDPGVYYVTRGNHDRLHTGVLYDGCSREGAANDCFGDAFSDSRFSVSIGTGKARYRFVGLDSNDPAGMGILPPRELEYLEAELKRGEITIPLFHHPASDLASITQVPPGVFGVKPDDALAFRQLLARHDNVGGVYSGHTHRNNRSMATGTGSLPFFEGGATKEYPGGYTVVRLYETGYLVNFYKTSAPEARAWSERSRGEYLGLYPYYTLGGLGDRNWSYDVDARVRRSAPMPVASPSGRPAPSGGGGTLPSTGTAAALAAAGAAALGAAAALTRTAPPPRSDPSGSGVLGET
jgi:hypothetical protein